MSTDEDQIRQVVATWLSATRSGDVDEVLDLMTDDVVFLVAGQPPMRKADFAKQARAQAGKDGPQIEGRSEIQEIRVSGDLAYLWQKLEIVVTPQGARPMTRTGHTLTIFQKQNGRWRLARDANLLAAASA